MHHNFTSLRRFKMTPPAFGLFVFFSIFRTSSSSSAKMNPLMTSDVSPTQCKSGSNFQCGPGTGFGCERLKSSETSFSYTVSSENSTVCSANQVTLSWTGQGKMSRACTHPGKMTVTVESPCWQKAMFPYGGDYKSKSCTIADGSTGISVTVFGDLFVYGQYTGMKRAVANVHKVECAQASNSKIFIVTNSGLANVPNFFSVTVMAMLSLYFLH